MVVRYSIRGDQFDLLNPARLTFREDIGCAPLRLTSDIRIGRADHDEPVAYRHTLSKVVLGGTVGRSEYPTS